MLPHFKGLTSTLQKGCLLGSNLWLRDCNESTLSFFQGYPLIVYKVDDFFKTNRAWVSVWILECFYPDKNFFSLSYSCLVWCSCILNHLLSLLLACLFQTMNWHYCCNVNIPFLTSLYVLWLLISGFMCFISSVSKIMFLWMPICFRNALHFLSAGSRSPFWFTMSDLLKLTHSISYCLCMDNLLVE